MITSRARDSSIGVCGSLGSRLYSFYSRSGFESGIIHSENSEESPLKAIMFLAKTFYALCVYPFLCTIGS